MNYEFHVGDYVETINGCIGWVSNIKDNGYIWVIDKNGATCTYHMPEDTHYFTRIGAYCFTKKEKMKIEKLTQHVTMFDIINKTNELVDAVNLLLDKSTES